MVRGFTCKKAARKSATLFTFMVLPGILHRYHHMNRVLLTLCLLLMAAPLSFGQRKKRKSDSDPDKPFYAYPTESTLRRKQRQPSVAGGNDNEFYTEKPFEQEMQSENDRTVDYGKPPYFGHRRPVTKRSVKSRKLCRVCGIVH